MFVNNSKSLQMIYLSNVGPIFVIGLQKDNELRLWVSRIYEKSNYNMLIDVTI